MAENLVAVRVPNQQTLAQARHVEIIDCLQLPHTIHWIPIKTPNEAWDAIKSMKIRGAPAIASLAALSIACELLDVLEAIPNPTPAAIAEKTRAAAAYLLTSRPTAVNLREALERIEKALKNAELAALSGGEMAQQIIALGEKVWSEDVQRNKDIGKHGAEWLLHRLESTNAIKAGEKVNVLTVCNTGSLATSGYGTALGLITALWEKGRLEHAYYAQTGPYQQGARLTSLELQHLKIPSTMVCDTAMAALMQGKSGRKIHAFVAGADRIAANGDTANKISTYQISLIAKTIPATRHPQVVVCAPITTFDLSMDDGSGIEIEERPPIEACTVRGRKYEGPENISSEVCTVLVTPLNTHVWNPAFDVTPAAYIDGIATELGVAEKHDDAFDLRGFVKAGGRALNGKRAKTIDEVDDGKVAKPKLE